MLWKMSIIKMPLNLGGHVQRINKFLKSSNSTYFLLLLLKKHPATTAKRKSNAKQKIKNSKDVNIKFPRETVPWLQGTFTNAFVFSFSG